MSYQKCAKIKEKDKQYALSCIGATFGMPQGSNLGTLLFLPCWWFDVFGLIKLLHTDDYEYIHIFSITASDYFTVQWYYYEVTD